MKLGISTYAFLWQWSDRSPSKISLREMIRQTKDYGGKVFQICDYPLIEQMDDDSLIALAAFADELNIELELGTKGVHPSILKRYLRIAKLLNVSMIRSMVHNHEYKPEQSQAIKWIQEVMPEFEQEGVTLALETYEQVSTDALINIVTQVNSSFLGICLDPGNTIASLEMPKDVIDKVSPYVVNLHVKDFQFIRNDGWVGFYLGGYPLGEGQLDLDYMLDSIEHKNVNVIIEMWLNFRDTYDETVRTEKEWLSKSVDVLNKKLKSL
ncbi:hypothetical protein J416_13641 [Gracilibacillus halophilus YIM-C55.5]|uniref:Xylose isomerase-like TIM barrel domain-containing protein n=1 Tax=Gracilibacillus halophilus YIM-C55.5 TaxID=1308866 RepID=N4WI91_9BACI|nr:sugar phosphate isomerase/epimerase family protein [Gracilibacillus halophilus]ENH95892.1 hypothetical protein J416_13641 [Gracilibacillus halophilus YIM-C55.5]